MRTFADICAELDLRPFLASELGPLHFTPITRERPIGIIVRQFADDHPGWAAAWARLTEAATTWIAARPGLAAVVRVAPLTEVGRDFIARTRFDGTSLAGFADDEDPPEPPPELATMHAQFRHHAADAPPADAPLVAVLARSILEPTYKTVFDYGDDQFVIGELKPTADDLERA